MRKITWERQPGKASNFSLPLHLWTEKPQPSLFHSPSSHFIQEWRFLCTLPPFHVCSRVRELLGLLSGFTIPPTICRCFSWIWLSYLTLNLWRNLKEILFLIQFFFLSFPAAAAAKSTRVWGLKFQVCDFPKPILTNSFFYYSVYQINPFTFAFSLLNFR